MTIAAKQLDLTIGIDLHLELVPMGPVLVPMIMPLPLPGLLFDPFAFLPLLGSGVETGGLPSAFAGSPAIPLIPHFPIGGVFMMPPGNTAQVFMGSSSVVIDGEPLTYTALPVLDCSSIGIPPIPRLKLAFRGMPTMFLPTSLVLTIPWGKSVEVGGTPTIMADALGMAVAGGALGIFGKAIGKLRKLRKLAKLAKPKKPRPSLSGTEKARCEHKCLAGHPVHVVTGANVDAFDDALVDGPLPIVWRRHYSSLDCDREGPMGRGFRHEYERALVRRPDGGLSYVEAYGSAVPLPPFGSDRLEVAAHGHVLRALADGRFELRRGDERMEFLVPPEAERGLIQRLAVGEDTLDFHYDDAGRLIAIWQAGGERLCLRYDEAGHVARIVWRGTRPSDEDETYGVYAYDAAGRLVEWRDADGNPGRYAYDAAHRLIQCSDRRGYAFLFRYDAEGRCVDSTGEDGLFHVALEYAPEERRTTVTHADGGRWVYRYDAQGTLTHIVDPYGGTRELRQDAAGRIVEDVDPNGNVTRLLYDHDGQHHARVDALGHVTRPLDAEPHPENPLAYTLPETPLEWEHATLLDRRRAGALDEASPVLALVPGALRDVVLDCGPARHRARREPLARDPNDNLVRWRDRDGHTRSWEYMSWNLVGREIDGVGHATAYSYTPQAKVTKVVGPTGTVTEYLYDHDDRVREVKLRGRVFETYGYDAAGNLVEKRGADGRVLLSLEAGRGNTLAVRRLASGETQRFERDAWGRLVAASTERMRATFEHDVDGRQIKDYRDGTGVRHVLQEGAVRGTVYFDRFEVGYRQEGEKRVITDPAGNEHHLHVDDGGLMVRQLSSGATEILRYDGEGRCLLKIWSSPGDGDAWVRRFHYSGERDLLAVEDSRAGTTRYEYDAAHRLRRRIRPDGAIDAFEHDAAGNLLSQPGLSGAVIGDGNVILTADRQRFAYDDRDQIASWRGPFGTRVFEYDSLDQLVRASIDGEPWTAVYDPLCRRVEKTWRGQTSRYYWDDFRPAAEVRADGSLRLYVYDGDASLSPFMFVEYASMDAAPETGRPYFIATDHLGVPVRVEDAAGAVVWAGTLDPYGRVHVEHAETQMPLRFPGHWHDAETGLHFNRFRYYSPDLGRYVGPDPWGIAGGVNLYAYVGEDNPLRAVDVDGLMMSAGRRAGSSMVRAASSGRLVPSSAGHAAPPPPRPTPVKPSSVAPAERQLCLPPSEDMEEFYHGSTRTAGKSMMEGLRSGGGQLGSGFYTTREKWSAEEYAEWKRQASHMTNWQKMREARGENPSDWNEFHRAYGAGETTGDEAEITTVRVPKSTFARMKKEQVSDDQYKEEGPEPAPDVDAVEGPQAVTDESGRAGSQTMFTPRAFPQLRVYPGAEHPPEGFRWVNPENRVDKKA